MRCCASGSPRLRQTRKRPRLDRVHRDARGANSLNEQRKEQHIQMEAKDLQPVVIKADHERVQLLAALRDALQKLPELDRQLVTLYSWAG
jgi:hypothetical protein